MPITSKDDLQEVMQNLAITLGEQVTQVTKHIEHLFPPTELSQWMDCVSDHMGGWFHRVKHGHDALANTQLVYNRFGVSGLVQYPFELGKDCLTPHGIPLPGSQLLYDVGLVSAKEGTEWLSVNVGDLLVGYLAIYSSYKLQKKCASGKLSDRDVAWATIGSITKIVGGLYSCQPVVIITGLVDGIQILENQFDLVSQLSNILDVDVEGLLNRMFKATAVGAIAGGLTAAGTYTATAALASASTGTAIASLSGAAATKATLAAIGGGALSVGGLGMLGGAIILSGGAAIIAVSAGYAAWYFSKE